MNACTVCSEPFETKPGGRPGTTCSAACRNRKYRASLNPERARELEERHRVADRERKRTKRDPPEFNTCPGCDQKRRRPGFYFCQNCHGGLMPAANIVRPEYLRPSVFTPWVGKVA